MRKKLILDLDTGIDDALAKELELWKSRVRPDGVDAERSDQTSAKADTRTTKAAPRRPAKVPPTN